MWEYAVGLMSLAPVPFSDDAQGDPALPQIAWFRRNKRMARVFEYRRKLPMAVGVASVACAMASTAEATSLSSVAFADLAARCAPSVSVETLEAVASAESSLDPWALHDNTTGVTVTPGSLGAALADARQWLGRGDSVDLGLMQINSANLASLHLTIHEALEPCSSLRAGAALLAKDYDGGKTPAEEQAALRTALSRYNTGTARGGFANGYVAKVVGAAKRVVPEIDPDAAAATKPQAAAVPKDWNVFPDSPGPGRLGPQPVHRAAGATKPAAPMRPGITKPTAPAWNVFPQSVGPGRLMARSPVTLAGHFASAARTASEEPDE